MFEKLRSREITQVAAAAALKITTRWLRKKYKRFLQEGDIGLIHKSRGRKSSKRLNREHRELLLSLLETTWNGFGPTYAADKLWEIYKIKVSPETLRQLMITEGHWKRRGKQRIHRKRRKRKESIGMLIQLDGSPHDWFEGRGPRCTLLVFIDDATSQILWLEFAKSESYQGVVFAVKHYLDRHGRPVAFYVDYGSVFSVNMNNPEREKLTQFERGMRELDIDIIHARSPQAKGRVERANETLQDRLVKDMRLAGISSIEEANKFVQEGTYLENHNARFAVEPEIAGNVHRSIEGYDLINILSEQHARVIANDYTVTYRRRIFQLEKHQPTIIRPKNVVMIHEHLDATIEIHIRQSRLNYKEIGMTKKNKISPVDYVAAYLDGDRGEINQPLSRVKPAGGNNPDSSDLLPTLKSGTNYVGEKRN